MDEKGCGGKLCGGSPAVRGEQVHVESATQAKLLGSANELQSFGIAVEQRELFWKVVGAPRGVQGASLIFEEPLDKDSERPG
jgi:hypothetical protein